MIYRPQQVYLWPAVLRSVIVNMLLGDGNVLQSQCCVSCSPFCCWPWSACLWSHHSQHSERSKTGEHNDLEKRLFAETGSAFLCAIAGISNEHIARTSRPISKAGSRFSGPTQR